MQLSVTERERLYAILEKYDQNPKVQQMREFIQHGDVTTYQHCKNVVLVSCWLNHRLHLGADETSLAVGAFLHDFYLYDWHKKGTFHGIRRLFEMHGFSHPGIFVIAVVIGMELVGPKYRKLASVITGFFFSVGQVGLFVVGPISCLKENCVIGVSTGVCFSVE